MSHHLLAEEGLGQIPKILTLLDRNPHSPTYGCFDRTHWHYRTLDFPNGMTQLGVLPLALAYTLDIAGNPFYRQDNLREWAHASIRFSMQNAHRDGSCDEYFPFERAGGATAFALFAALQAYEMLNLADDALLAFFERRASWLAGHLESGRLANHQALISLCLYLAGRLLSTDRWRAEAQRRLDLVLSWQTDEGWFQEYDGCDPGYLTWTISFLAHIHQLEPSPRLQEALTSAVRFAAHFVHPDGSFGGENGNRNSHYFFPQGFELVGRWLPEALAVNDRFLVGLQADHHPCFTADNIVFHHVWNYLTAWRDRVADRPKPDPIPEGRTWFPKAGMLIERRRSQTVYAALHKGGVFQGFCADQPALADTHFSVRLRDGRNAVGHLAGDYEVEITPDRVIVSGSLVWAKQTRMTYLNMLILRGFMLSVGWMCANFVRRLLQKMLIVGRREAPFRFRRDFCWDGATFCIEDQLEADSWDDVTEVILGRGQTSTFADISRTFHYSQLLPWTDLTKQVQRLAPGEKLTVSRRLEEHVSDGAADQNDHAVPPL